jgi:acyl-CoA reductase-like NAD-dependent aldehyde dehydrogenase
MARVLASARASVCACAARLQSCDNAQGYIHSGIAEGARLVAGGLGLPEGLTKGFFVRPTVFADVKPGMTIEKEEIFGPVLCILPFDDEAHAVRLANDTPYGLTNYVRCTKRVLCKPFGFAFITLFLGFG